MFVWCRELVEEREARNGWLLNCCWVKKVQDCQQNVFFYISNNLCCIFVAGECLFALVLGVEKEKRTELWRTVFGVIEWRKIDHLFRFFQWQIFYIVKDKTANDQRVPKTRNSPPIQTKLDKIQLIRLQDEVVNWLERKREKVLSHWKDDTVAPSRKST